MISLYSESVREDTGNRGSITQSLHSIIMTFAACASSIQKSISNSHRHSARHARERLPIPVRPREHFFGLDGILKNAEVCPGVRRSNEAVLPKIG